MSFVSGTPEYDYLEQFNTYVFVSGLEFFCELEADAKGASLSKGADSIAKICLSPCRVTDPFIKEERMIAEIPEDRRFVIVTCDYSQKKPSLILKMYKTWAETITKGKMKEKDLVVEFSIPSEEKGELFKVDKILSMEKDVYNRYHNLYIDHFLPNLKEYAACELFEENLGSAAAQWPKTFKSKLEAGAAIKKIKETPGFCMTKEEVYAAYAKENEEDQRRWEARNHKESEEDKEKPPLRVSRDECVIS